MDRQNPSRPDDWDDSVILSSFETGIQSFRTKNQTSKQTVESRKSPASSSYFAGCLSSNPESSVQSIILAASPSAQSSIMDAPVFSTNTDSCADTRKRKLDDTSETAHKITDTADNAAPPKVANVQRQIQRQATPPQQERHAADTGRRGIENINSSSNSNVSNSNVSNSNSSGSYPALPPSTGNVAEDEALQGLLMAWYYSGYATGRYQALKDLGYYDTCGGGNSTAATVDGAACTGGTCAAAAVEREEGGAGGVCSGGETSTS